MRDRRPSAVVEALGRRVSVRLQGYRQRMRDTAGRELLVVSAVVLSAVVVVTIVSTFAAEQSVRVSYDRALVMQAVHAAERVDAVLGEALLAVDWVERVGAPLAAATDAARLAAQLGALTHVSALGARLANGSVAVAGSAAGAGAGAAELPQPSAWMPRWSEPYGSPPVLAAIGANGTCWAEVRLADLEAQLADFDLAPAEDHRGSVSLTLEDSGAALVGSPTTAELATDLPLEPDVWRLRSHDSLDFARDVRVEARLGEQLVGSGLRAVLTLSVEKGAFFGFIAASAGTTGALGALAAAATIALYWHVRHGAAAPRRHRRVAAVVAVRPQRQQTQAVVGVEASSSSSSDDDDPKLQPREKTTTSALSRSEPWVDHLDWLVGLAAWGMLVTLALAYAIWTQSVVNAIRELGTQLAAAATGATLEHLALQMAAPARLLRQLDADMALAGPSQACFANASQGLGFGLAPQQALACGGLPAALAEAHAVYADAGLAAVETVWVGFDPSGVALQSGPAALCDATTSLSGVAALRGDGVLESPYVAAEQPWWSSSSSSDAEWLTVNGAELAVRAGAEWRLGAAVSRAAIGADVLAASPVFRAGAEMSAFVTRLGSAEGLLLGELVAASEGAIEGRDGSTLLAAESDSLLVAESAAEVNARVARPNKQRRPDMFPDGLDTRAAETTLRYGADRAWTNLQELAELQWLVVVSLPQSQLYDELFDWDSINILIALGGVVGSIFVLVAYASGTSASAAPGHSRPLPDQMASNTDPEYWRQLARELEPHVQAAMAASAASAASAPEPVQKRARRYIADSLYNSERHVLESLAAEAAGVAWLYRVYTHRVYTAFAQSVILAHMAIALWEAPAYDFDGEGGTYFDSYGPNMLALHALCVLCHVGDLAVHLRVFGLGLRRSLLRESTSAWTLVRVAVVAALALDLLVLAATDYRVELSSQGDLRVTTLLPATVVLRPLLLILRNEDIKLALTNFLATLLLAKHVVIIGLTFLCVGVGLAIALLQGVYDGDALGRNVDDYRSAFILTFVFIFSGENYPDVVHPASASSRWFRVYFIFFAFAGAFLLLSLIIAHFQQAYQNRLSTLKKMETTARRLAMLVAFVVLDGPGAGHHLTLVEAEYQPFLLEVGAGLRAVSGPLEVLDFVAFVERLIYEAKFDSAVVHFTTQSKRRLALHRYSWPRRQVRALRPWAARLERLSFVVACASLWLLFLLGTGLDDEVVARYALVPVAYGVAETVARVMATDGPCLDFVRRASPPGDPHLQAAHRFDVFACACTVVAYAAAAADAAGPVPRHGAARIALAVPALRLFTVVRSNRDLMFGLFSILGGFLSILALLITTIYAFAAAGTLAFAGYFEFMPDRVYDMRDASFDSLTESVATLFQVMLGESWDLVMFAAMDTPYGLSAGIFFCSYVLLVTVLFSNLFIGVVCGTFSKLQSASSAPSASARSRGGAPPVESSKTYKRELIAGEHVHLDIVGRDMRRTAVVRRGSAPIAYQRVGGDKDRRRSLTLGRVSMFAAVPPGAVAPPPLGSPSSSSAAAPVAPVAPGGGLEPVGGRVEFL